MSVQALPSSWQFVCYVWNIISSVSVGVSARRVLEPLKKAPPPEPRKLTEKEQKKLMEQEEDTLRELRIFLRDILSKLGREKKFTIFTKPVDIEDVSSLTSVMIAIDLPSPSGQDLEEYERKRKWHHSISSLDLFSMKLYYNLVNPSSNTSKGFDKKLTHNYLD